MDRCAFISSCNYWWCQYHKDCLEYQFHLRKEKSFSLQKEFKDLQKKKKKKSVKPRKFNPNKYIGKLTDQREIKKGPIAKRNGFETDIIVGEYHYIHCHYCGFLIHLTMITRDHKHPTVRGGKNTKDNIVPACVECNTEKGKMLYEEYLQYRYRSGKSMSPEAMKNFECNLK